MFRPAQLVRRVRPLAGHPRVRFVVRPSGDWGATPPTLTRGSHHLRYVLPGCTLRLNTSVPLTYLIDGTWFTLQAPVSLLLGPDETLAGGIEETAREFEEQTALYWRHWTRRLAVPLEWQDAVIRAAITLKLCQYEETGAIVAAMTTSIPEAPHSGRNWDYRYCWLRDAFFVVRALNSLAEVGTMESYLHWLYNVVRGAEGGHVQPLYGIGLERSLPESIVAHAGGYRGMGPVRVGNQAQEHFQHDVYGSVVLGAAQAFHDHRLLVRGDHADFAALEVMGEQAWRLHDQPDAGIWELRTRARVHTSSALMCWAACDRLARIAVVLGLPERASLWQPAGGGHSREHPAARLERRAPGLRRKPGRARPGRQRAADGRGGFPAAAGPALREHGAGAGTLAVRRRVHAPLRGRGRLWPARRPPSTSALSGASTRWHASAGARRRARLSRPCWHGATKWACSAKTSIRSPVNSGATFRRPTPWSASSTARCACRRRGTVRCEFSRTTLRILPLPPAIAIGSSHPAMH